MDVVDAVDLVDDVDVSTEVHVVHNVHYVLTNFLNNPSNAAFGSCFTPECMGDIWMIVLRGATSQ
jgi:hypothetical protein